MANQRLTMQFTQSVGQLLPTGFAWPKQKSVIGAWLKSWSTQLAELHEFTDMSIAQWWPHITCTRLEEWEEALGLPDPCFGIEQDKEQRRLNMLGRLRPADLPYHDSSPAAPDYIKALCAAIGYNVEVWYNWPFRVGRNKVGQRLGMLDGILNVQVIRVCEPFRVGEHRVRRRLVECTQDSTDLICYLKRIVPARYEIRTIF